MNLTPSHSPAADPAHRLPRSRLLAADTLRLGGLGLRGRPLRAALSALGIAIGVATLVAVLGISASSQAQLLAQIDALGTNLLTLTPGQTLFGQNAELPAAAPAMTLRIPGVQTVASTGALTSAIYRNTLEPAASTNGVTVVAASLGLLHTVGGRVAAGTWLNQATARYPAVVLGAVAARRLGFDRILGNPQVYLGGQWFTLAGILAPVALAPEIDTAALVGIPVATARLGFDGHPTTIYERSTDISVPAVRNLLPATADPANPEQVVVSRPSDALVARADAAAAFGGLFLGLGAVSLLVGGVGIANVMVISVLERRSEIGLRRALGARRTHIAIQFLTEAVLLTSGGSVAGIIAGAAITAGYATHRGAAVVIPSNALLTALTASIGVGTIAGIYPAIRAAGLAPTQAIRSV